MRPRVDVLLDTSALLGLAAGHAGVVEQLGTLDRGSFGVPARALVEAVNVEPMVPHLVTRVEHIVNFPGCTLVSVEGMAEMRKAYEEMFLGRPDVVAALLTSYEYGRAIATYRPDVYEVAGFTFGQILPLVDGWAGA